LFFHRASGKLVFKEDRGKTKTGESETNDRIFDLSQPSRRGRFTVR